MEGKIKILMGAARAAEIAGLDWLAMQTARLAFWLSRRRGPAEAERLERERFRRVLGLTGVES